MSDRPIKKKSGCLKFFLFAIVIVLAMPLIWLSINYRPLTAAGKPLVKVSTETTRITEPLDENGDVDYLEALNIRLSAGFTPENNAAVLYARAFGSCTVDEESFTRYLNRLGIDGSLIYDNPLIDFDEWIYRKEREPQIDNSTHPSTSEDALEQYRYLMDDAAPWSSDQFPIVDEWLKEYRDVAETIRDATKRERCYFPLVARSYPQVMSALLPHPQKMRHAARYFSISALRQLHTNEFEKFIADLQCMERIAQHVAQGPTTVEELISIAIKRMILARIIAACDLELETDDLQRLLAFTKTIEPLDDLVSRIDNCERFMVLDAAVSSVSYTHLTLPTKA